MAEDTPDWAIETETPDWAKEEAKPQSTWGETALDVAKQLPAGIAAGYAGPDWLRRAGQAQLEAENLTNLPAPKAADYAEAAAKALPEPTTAAGRIARAAGESVPMAAAFGTPAGIPAQMVAGAAGKGLAETGILPEWLAEPAGAIVGGGLASAAPRALQAAGTGLAKRALPEILRPTPRSEISPELSRAFLRDNDSFQAATRRLDDIRSLRPDATLADVSGPNVRGVVERLAQTPGAGLKVVEPNLTAQQKGQLDRVSRDLTWATGTAQSAFRATEDTMASMKQAAAPLYERAYGAGDREIWSSELERLAGAPSLQSAMRKAVTTWRNQSIADGYGAMNPTMAERGGLLKWGGSMPAFPNLQFWDYTKRALDDQIGSITRAGKSPRALTVIAQKLRGELDRLEPSYAQARNAWSGPSRYLESIEDGKGILNRNITAEEMAHNFGALTDAEKEGYRIGAVTSILTRMRSNPAKLPDLTRDLRSPDMRAKMDVLLPTPQAAERFNRILDYEIKSSELTRGALGNSRTAIRQAMQQEGESIVGELAAHAISHKMGLGFLRGIYSTFAQPVRDTLRSRADRSLAELLTTPQPARALQQYRPPRPSVIGPAIGQAIKAPLIQGASGFKKGGRVLRSFRVKA